MLKKHFFNQKGLFPLVTHLKIIENDNLAETLNNLKDIEVAKIEGSVDLKPFYMWMDKTLQEEDHGN